MASGNSIFQLITLVFLLYLVESPFLEAFKSNSGVRNFETGCIEKERDALLKFKEGLKDPSGWLSSWVGDDCCNWVGVGCSNQTGHVVRLELQSLDSCNIVQENEAATSNKSCLFGTLNPSLLNLTYLNYLDLSYNNFLKNPIPEFIGSLKNLRYLDLSDASFSGRVPPSIGNLSNLQHLDLLMYSYPDNLWALDLNWLHGLSSLQYLSLGGMNLSQVTNTWLQDVNMLPSLRQLDMSGCELQNFPQSLPYVNFTSLSKLYLFGNNFSSPIPQWLFNISTLVTVDLSSTGLSGFIPKVQSGNLCNLVSLDLSYNEITGEITEFIDALSECNNSTLWSLNLTSNSLGGVLPDSLGYFKSLQFLTLSQNLFLGPLPLSIGNLSYLLSLDLSSNLINGTIPETIGQLTELGTLDLNNNSWNGAITENHFRNLTRVSEITLSSTSNSLVFNLRDDWIAPFNLTTLRISNCQLGPAFPHWLKTQAQLSEITLSNAFISDTIPEWFWGFSSGISWLDLSNNQLRGELPKSINFDLRAEINLGFNSLEGSLPLNWSNVTELSLRNNLFSGPIPSHIGQGMPTMEDLDLSRNLLNGSIPTSLSEMRNLSFLDLSSNHLSGEIPSNWQGLEQLRIVDLSNNTLSGGMPSSICSLPSLNWLKLSGNSLSGELHISLQNCSKILNGLDLGDNKFFWTIPDTSSLWYLSYLSLRGNNLTGNVPEKLCQLTYLQILDLAHNNLSGPIPKCLGSLEGMKYMGIYFKPLPSTWNIDFSEHVEIVVKGGPNEYTRTFFLLRIIDLSGNNLMGEIPEEITYLSAMDVLRLSDNQLTGKIPESIANLNQLETLDLSSNHLSGPIPSSMSSMSFMSHLNLSYNNLSGQIPSGNQFNTWNDPSTYVGNPYLCGPPLTANCSSGLGDGNSQKKNEEVGDEDKSEKFWFYVSVALGFIVGFWGVCGTLVIKKSWRHAYFRFVEDVKDKLFVNIAVGVARLGRKVVVKR